MIAPGGNGQKRFDDRALLPKQDLKPTEEEQPIIQEPPRTPRRPPLEQVLSFIWNQWDGFQQLEFLISIAGICWAVWFIIDILFLQ